MVLLLLALGCETTREQDLPSLAEIAPAQDRWGINQAQARDNALNQDWRAEFAIGVISVALDEPTQSAWAVASTDWLDPKVAGLWLKNGLAGGTLVINEWTAFESRLPPVLSRGSVRVRAAGDWQVLAEVPLDALNEPLTVTLGTDRDGAPVSKTMGRGNLRLLAQARPAGDGGVFVGIWLQQHVPDRLGVVREADGAIRPMTLDEQFETGWFMHELVQEVPVPRGQVLVVGLHRPWGFVPTVPLEPDAWPRALRAMGVVCAAAFGTQYERPDRVFQALKTPELKPNLGSALLTQTLRNDASQRLFLIGPSLP